MGLLVMVFVSRGSAGVSRIAGCTGLNITFGGSEVFEPLDDVFADVPAAFTLRAGAGGAQRSIALRFMAMSISMYSLVVVMLTCPGQDLITLSPAPDWSRCMAVVW